MRLGVAVPSIHRLRDQLGLEEPMPPPGPDPDELALIRGVLESPDDDLPRLVLADWLDEHAEAVTCPACKGTGVPPIPPPPPLVRDPLTGLVGQDWSREVFYRLPRCGECGGNRTVSDGRKERAEFIRLGVSHPRHDDAAHAVQQRLRELRRVLWPSGPPETAWVPQFGDDFSESVYGPWKWSRGFVSSVSLPLAAFLQHAEAIFRSHPVTAVRITDREPCHNGNRRMADGTFERGRSWVRSLFTDDPTTIPHEIPSVILDLLANGVPDYGVGSHYRKDRSPCPIYASDDLAHAALSAACVAYGRRLAGMSEYTPATSASTL